MGIVSYDISGITKQKARQTPFTTRRKGTLPVLKNTKKESKRAPKDHSAEKEHRESREQAREAEQSVGSIEEIGSYRWQRWRSR